uniref:Ribosomal protein S13 n=1 Tax=Scytosiphon lomentaria TaxID=27967 RepID=A0A0U1XCC6_SCYLO|nr:ribosomal protein S13 [Scytosiphon lomentaria]AIQ78527.1 ribosomal protein S13 [Scytosiphon lomentaria]
MPYIIGTPIPEEKVLVQSLSHIYGIGLYQSKILCKKAGFGSDSRGKDVSFPKGKILENLAEGTSLPLGADLRRFQNDKIRRLCALSTYRGSRHRKGLPVRGQRTHTNSKKRPIPKLNVSSS